MTSRCIACDSSRVTSLGPLPIFTADLLGSSRDGQLTCGLLYECRDCSIRYRSPAASEEELSRYYSHLSGSDCWKCEADREVWREIKQTLESSPNRSVLDVGCFRGDLLEYLGKDWERFGVEPSNDARLVAEARGITIVADRIESLRADGPKFGAITLIDVIEHLLRPLQALRKLIDRVQPGGKLVIFTGNTDSWSWRFAGLNYWYSGLPEHVAFFNPRWFEWAAPMLNCRVTSIRRLRYQPAPVGTRLDEALKNIAFVTYRQLESFPRLVNIVSRLPVVNRVGTWESCWWTTARDHILVVLTKDM